METNPTRRFPAPGRAGRGAWTAASGCLLALWLACQPALATSDIALEKTVSDPTLFPGAAVEFTITVHNLGPDATNAAQVTDRLPPGLVIPAGTTPYTSQGYYDPASGRWTLDDLAAGASGALVIPAQVTANPLPPCLVNEAVADRLDVDPNPDNERAYAALRAPGVERCVDLFIVQSSLLLKEPVCTSATRVMMTVSVSNLGPDPARRVTVQVDSDRRDVPNLTFRDDRCETSRQDTCVLAEILPGETLLLPLYSDEFKNGRDRMVEVAATVTSPDPDLSPADNASTREWFLPEFRSCPLLYDASSAGSGCFIATAAYGSSLDPRVDSLRRFRDTVLMRSRAGRAAVALYYRWSPPAADFIAERPLLRALVRALLWPVVAVIDHPRIAGALCLLAIAALGLRFRRRWAGPAGSTTPGPSRGVQS